MIRRRKGSWAWVVLVMSLTSSCTGPIGRCDPEVPCRHYASRIASPITSPYPSPSPSPDYLLKLGVVATPASVQGAGGTFTCRLDSGLDPSVFSAQAALGWQVSGGTLSGQQGKQVTWQVPSQPGTYGIQVVVRQGSYTGVGSVSVQVSATRTNVIAAPLPEPTADDSQVVTIAGNGKRRYSGEGIAATGASLGRPHGIAIDRTGNLYVADADNHRIRMIDSQGFIRTVAGNGVAESSGDGGPATQASLNMPVGVAVDPLGNLFISEWAGARIRQIDTRGIIRTVARSGEPNGLDYVGPALNAYLSGPFGLAADAYGNLWFADVNYNLLQHVDAAGTIRIVSGSSLGNGYDPRPGEPARNHSLQRPKAVAISDEGELYFSDGSSHVFKISPDGRLFTVAGLTVGAPYVGPEGDGGLATLAQLWEPHGIAVRHGTLYIADTLNHRIRAVGADGFIRTIAGSGQPGYIDDVPASVARFNLPVGVAVGLDGAVYVADAENCRIRKITLGKGTQP